MTLKRLIQYYKKALFALWPPLFIFLTLVFNGSPSITLLNNSSKKKFIAAGFIKQKLKLMKKNKFLTKENKITQRGRFVLHITNILSNFIFKEND